MKLHLPWRRRGPRPEPPAGEELEALANARRYEEEQGSIRAIFKKMGRENLDAPFRRD